jgi:uncharacterized protein with ParB-like and HNH nuclease domain
MHAHDTKLQPLIEGTKQYIIPLFQRPYSWEKQQWTTLWDDIHELATESPSKTHFMGAIVTMPAHTIPEGITKFLLIDGQQRLTTILLLMMAIRDKAKAIAGNLSAKIHEHYLTNKFNEDEDFYKLLPTQVDRQSFVSLVQGDPPSSKTKIQDAYSFFSRKLVNASKDELDKLFNTVVSKLLFVSVVLAGDDNAYLIFEGLNAKGLPLTQADLIRNYLLMRIHRNRQDRVYNTTWLPMQNALGADLTEYIRHFLMRNSSFIKQSEVYANLKAVTENFTEEDTIGYLETLHRFSSYYQRLLNPHSEPTPQVRTRLCALKRLDITTAYPFLLDLFDDLAFQRCTEDTFISVLKTLETFLVRRFVCSVPTHDLNKFFPSVLAQANQYPTLLEGVADLLSKRSFPKNAEFRQQFFVKKMYGSGERAVKTKLILERLEESYGHKEEVQTDDLQIEHIMPQTLTDWWKAELGENWEQVHERYLDTIGNLTLTGYNPALSNASFDDKKKIYADSHLEITKRISSDAWAETEIRERIEELYERAIAIWPSLGNMTDDMDEFDEGNGLLVEDESCERAMRMKDLLTLLGGGEPIKPSKNCFHLVDGNNVLVTVSKQFPKSKPYWYGISEASIKLIDAHGCAYVAFGLGTSRVALVPAGIVREYVKYCTVTRYKSGEIHHYHFSITGTEPPELYGNQDSPRIDLTEYIRKPADALAHQATGDLND